MATKKEPHTTRPEALAEPHITHDDRKDKVGGKTFLLGEDWVMPGQMGVLKAGAKLVESNYGWFTPYTAEGMRMHFMVGKETTAKLKTIKITHNED